MFWFCPGVDFEVGLDIIEDKGDGIVCAQIITVACNPSTGELKEFPNSCIAEGWTIDMSKCPGVGECDVAPGATPSTNCVGWPNKEQCITNTGCGWYMVVNKNCVPLEDFIGHPQEQEVRDWCASAATQSECTTGNLGEFCRWV